MERWNRLYNKGYKDNIEKKTKLKPFFLCWFILPSIPYDVRDKDTFDP